MRRPSITHYPLLAAATLAVQACALVSADEAPTRGQGESARQFEILCLANVLRPDGNRDPDADLWIAEAGAVCDLWRKLPRVRSALMVERTTPTSQQLIEVIRSMSPHSIRVVVYVGHGVLEKDRPLQIPVSSPSGTGSTSFSVSELTAALAGNPSKGNQNDVWGVLVLNTCDAGYADVRGTRQNVSVLGSGYGAVSYRRPTALAGDNAAVKLQSIFFEYLVEAISGHADQPPLGDCDGVITDREAADYIDYRIGRLRHNPAVAGKFRNATSRDDRTQLEYWLATPMAVLRSNSPRDLPLATPGRAPACPSTAQFASPDLGDDGKPQRPRLFIRGATQDQLRAQLSDPSDPTQQTFVLKSSEHQPDLGRHSYRLTVEPEAGGSGTYLELRMTRSEAVVWATVTHLNVVQQAKLVRTRIPTGTRLFDWGSESPAGTPFWGLWLEEPVVPDATVTVSSAGSTPGASVTHSLQGLLVAPCPTGRGQCFLLPKGPLQGAAEGLTIKRGSRP